MHVVRHVSRQRAMQGRGRVLPSPGRRAVVNDMYLGLGEVDGLFNIGKMFTRMLQLLRVRLSLRI